MNKQPTVDWIELEFFAAYPYGHFCLRYKPNGEMEYTGDGDISMPVHGAYFWEAPPRVFKNLARILLERRWEKEMDPAGEGFEVCDGWSETLRWSIQGETLEYNVQIGVGRESILKIIERLGKLLKEEKKKHPPLHI
jgi:hypothetical protein